MLTTIRPVLFACVLLLVARSEPVLGQRSAFEPGQQDIRRNREEIKRRAAEARAEGERRAEEIKRKIAEDRTKNAKRWTNTQQGEQTTESTQPKVIDIEYEDS